MNIDNFEFRQNWFSFIENIITADEFLKSLEDIITEIENYNDDKTLNKFYAKIINNIKNNNTKLLSKLKEHGNNYNDGLTDKISQKASNRFVANYYDLIDARIMHGIHVNKDKKYIYICAGDDHIQNIRETLEQIGYKQTAYKEEFIDKREEPLNVNKFITVTEEHTVEVVDLNEKQPISATSFLLIIILIGVTGIIGITRRFRYILKRT